MITIDTLKLGVPADAIMGIDQSKFVSSISKRMGSDMVTSYYATGQVAFGINDIRYHPGSESVVLSLSAKCLGNDYFQGISTHTYERMVDAINSTGIVSLCADVMYDDAKVLLCDVSNSISVSDKKETLKAIAYMNTSYGKSIYPIRGSSIDTVMFSKQVKTSSLRDKQRHYDKFNELMCAKNKGFKNTLSTGTIQSAVNVIRVESVETSLAGIRKTFAINDNKLSSVLESTINVHGLRFERIKNSAPQLELFDSIVSAAESFDKHDSFIKHYGMITIIEHCGCDIDRLREVLSKFAGLNVRRELTTKYKPLIEQLTMKANNDSIVSNIHLESYLNALKAA